MFDVTLIPTLTKLCMPARYSANLSVNGLRIICLASESKEVPAAFEPYKSRGTTCRRLLANTANGEKFVIEFASFSEKYDLDISGVIRTRQPTVEGSVLQLRNAEFRDLYPELSAVADLSEKTRVSWAEGITYKVEEVGEGGEVLYPGLRIPQIGALHAIASHLTLSNEPATVILPTGTGKTEVMIATFVAATCKRLLVVVPTDTLRKQTAEKFQTYGRLKQMGVVGDILPPVVGILSSKPTSAHFDALRACNVVVTTMNSIRLADDVVQEAFASIFSHICFDEAHHIGAKTWKKFQRYCANLPTFLFTATPFREDGKSLEGKIIYNFPLSGAQDRGYFSPIRFAEVFEPDQEKADKKIADVAVAQLRKDLKNGHDHILLARVGKIKDAQKLFDEIYLPLFSDLNPVVIHSDTPNKHTVLEAIREGQHRIIICVKMFGEGFDLSSLKIAALHDIHKSLGITLQFIGRLARTEPGVGSATFVANTADDGVPEALESLYLEDADWNLLVADFSYDAIDPQTQLSELVANLEPIGDTNQEVEISTLALRPKISAQVYRTANFFPHKFSEAFQEGQHIFQPQISQHDNFLVLIANQSESIDWTDSRDIALDSWDLYIAYFDPSKKLLYIHSTRKRDAATRLAKAIARDPVPIQGEEPFKAFAGLKRLVLHSVGLSSRSRNIRYQMFAGLDVRNAINPLQQQSKMKSNVMGVGYEDGRRRSIGCSRKGKVWSAASGSLAQWKCWCDEVGAKLSNSEIQPNDFLRHTLIPVAVDTLPQEYALMVDWPDQLFESSNFRFQVSTPHNSFDFHDCELKLDRWEEKDSFTFSLFVGEYIKIQFRLCIEPGSEGESTYSVRQISGSNVTIKAGGRPKDAAVFFSDNPPLVRLADGSQLSGNILLKPQGQLEEVFSRDQIKTLDWSGTDLTKESRWKDGKIRNESIQQRFIQHLEEGAAQFIIDDDDQGESADIVAIEETEDTITVYLWHCKYSGGPEPGHRANDLYEVCGQAQKSVKWTWSLNTVVKHLTARESKYRRGRKSRFVRGSMHTLATLRKGSRRKFVKYRVGIVQPGLSKAQIPNDHLAIIGSTDSLIQIMTDNPLLVYGSE